MNHDYTFDIFEILLNEFINKRYKIVTFEEYDRAETGKILILRHDIDRWPGNAMKMAKIEARLGIKATYFFRILPSVFKPEIIEAIRDLDHEIGYHYEDLVLCNGDIEEAYEFFKHNLENLRKLYPIRTICMHGSPLSKWDSKKIWDKFNYKESGIVGAVNFDVDYNDVFYITDNGRSWNKTESSIRDKVKTNYDIPINGTHHFIDLLQKDQLPDKIMLNAHPDTFFDYGLKWYSNKFFIEIKNIVKKIIVRYNIIK
jgi:hypothetical protein